MRCIEDTFQQMPNFANTAIAGLVSTVLSILMMPALNWPISVSKNARTISMGKIRYPEFLPKSCDGKKLNQQKLSERTSLPAWWEILFHRILRSPKRVAAAKTWAQKKTNSRVAS